MNYKGDNVIMEIFELEKLAEEKICKYRDDVAAVNDHMADNPEVSGEEYETSKYLVKYLKEKGYNVEFPFAGYNTAFNAVYGADNHTHKIALFAEYDALPGIGHGCGHCLSGSISILAGRSLIELQDKLDCDVHIIGTPKEEINGAKCTMANDGVFDNYSMASMVHLYNKNIIAPQLIALDSFMYNFHGKVAHSAVNPWDGINAFNAVSLMFHGIDMLRQHVKPDVRIHGVIKHAGDAANIVPDKTCAEIYVRSPQWKDVEELVKKIDNCAEAGCLATGATWDKCRTAEPYYNLKWNDTGHKVLEGIYKDLDLNVHDDFEEVFGSTDAGNVSYICPAFHPCLQVVDEDVLIHTREFAAAMKSERAHNVLATGAKILCYQIIRTFADEKTLAAMKADFEAAK